MKTAEECFEKIRQIITAYNNNQLTFAECQKAIIEMIRERDKAIEKAGFEAGLKSYYNKPKDDTPSYDELKWKGW